MLIGAGRVIENIQNLRLCHLQGRFGAGKTAMAVRLYPEFAKRGYRLLTNTRCVWNEDMAGLAFDEGHMLHLYLMLDEGGIYFSDREEAKELISYAAKVDIVYVIPSFEPPHRKLRPVVIQPVYSWKGIGIPLIRYEFRIKAGFFEDKGSFFWFDPSEVYGVYSRQDPGANPDDIMRWLTRMKKGYREHFGYTDTGTVRFLDVISEAVFNEAGTVAQGRREADRLSDLVDEVEEASATFAALLKGTSIKKRRR